MNDSSSNLIMAEYALARKAAFRLLNMRNYHSAVLLRKLELKGFSKEVCEKVVEDCKRIGFIKDEDAILREFRRGYGPRYIEFKLQLDRKEVRDLITRQMQREKMLELAKKLGTRERAMRTLQRKGFDFDLIIEVIAKI